MKIEGKTENNITVLTLEGNLAMDECGELRTEIKPYVEQEDIVGIVLNLKSVDYIDSSGIGLIVSIFKSLKQLEKKFALTSLNYRHREVLSITKLDKILTIAEDTESALKILAAN